MLYSCLLVYVITPITPMGVITGVWNLSTSTDYICCIVVSLCMLLHPLCMGVITQVWNHLHPMVYVYSCYWSITPMEWVSTSTDYICCIVVFLVYVITPMGLMGV